MLSVPVSFRTVLWRFLVFLSSLHQASRFLHGPDLLWFWNHSQRRAVLDVGSGNLSAQQPGHRAASDGEEISDSVIRDQRLWFDHHGQNRYDLK